MNKRSVLLLSIIGIVILSFSLRFNAKANALIQDFFSPFVNLQQQLSTFFGLNSDQQISTLQKDQVALLQKELETLRTENRILRRKLSLPPSSNLHTIIAKIITQDPLDGGRILRIDRGEADGLQKGQIVLSGGYLLGQIQSLSRHTALVITLRDPNFRLRVVIDIDGQLIPGTLMGDLKMLWQHPAYTKISHLPRNLNYPPGKIVKTAPNSRIIPPNIPIGRIANTNNESTLIDNLYKQVSIALLAYTHPPSYLTIVLQRKDKQ